MEYLDLTRRPGYSGMNMQTTNGHAFGPTPQGPQYPFWGGHPFLTLYHQQQQQQQRAVMMAQGNVHSAKTEPKPRLAKDEVELLESEFAKNPKPNSSTKRELAEQMGVEVPRINVGHGTWAKVNVLG
jgi:hypothetical protein